MLVRNAEFEDMALAGHIMAVSFRSAFGDFVSRETMDACAQEDNCAAMLARIFRQGKVRFLIGENSGMLAWHQTEEGAEIISVHSLRSSWGTGLGAAMLTEALNQIGDQPVFLWVFRENTRARRFYEKHGLRWDGSERVSQFDGAVEVRYVRG